MHQILQHNARTLASRCLPSLPHCTNANHRGRIARSLITMASTTAVPGPPVRLHAASPAELAAARSALSGVDLPAHKPGSDRETQHLALSYDGDAAEDPSSAAAFNSDAYFAALSSGGGRSSGGGGSGNVLGRLLLTAATISSTQEVVQENAARLPDGLIFVADRQAGGRGRGGNVWESPPGCLMFSALRHLAIPGTRLPFVQYIVSLAVVQAAQEEAARLLGLDPGTTSSSGGAAVTAPSSSGGSSNGGASGGLSSSARPAPGPLDVRIKWPNDLYAGPLKIGGVLCHSAYRGGVFQVTMGVGLNVANAQPTTCLDTLIAAAAAARGLPPPPRLRREDLLACIARRLGPALDLLAAEGFAPFEADYYAAWLHGGQEVTLAEEGGTGGVAPKVRIQGLSPHGYLLASDASGERYELHPDGNSLDFFRGLVRRKLPAS